MFKRLITLMMGLMFAALVFNPSFAEASGQLTGTFTTPNTSIPLKNATVTFNLTQAGVDVGNSFNIAASQISCYTSSVGAIVGLPDPLVTPNVSAANTGGGSLAGGTYYVKVAYWTGATITSPSQASSVSIGGANNSIVVNAPVLQPAGATGYKIYAGQVQGSETLQQTVTGFGNFTLLTLVSGAALSGNTTVCSFTFNDSIIPQETKYRVNIVDVNGRQVAGFPQVWDLRGSTINIASIVPVAGVGQVRYPTPILATPLSSYATQSVNSPLTLNGFPLTVGATIYPNNTTPPPCVAGQSVVWTDNTGVLKGCQNGGSAVSFLNLPSGGWAVNGTDIREQVVTNDVLVGWNTHDLTPQTGPGAGTNLLISRNFIYATDTGTGSNYDARNTHVAVLGVLDSPNEVVFGAGISGTQANGIPIVFLQCQTQGMCASGGNFGSIEFGRLEVGGRWVLGNGTTSPDFNGGALYVRGSTVIANGTTNVQAVKISATGGGSGTGIIESTFSGGGSNKPLAIYTGGSESCRWDTLHNFVCGATSDDDATGTVIETIRSVNGNASIGSWNNGNGTIAYGSVYAKAGNTFATAPTVHLGVTTPGYSMVGAYYPSMAFIQSNANATNGILIDALAGPVAIRANGTTELSVTGGVGVALGHALPVTSGGTGNTSAWTSTGVLYASSVSATATSANFIWDNSNKWAEVAGNYIIKPAAPNYPTAIASAVLNLYYDSNADVSFISSANYNGPVYKGLDIVSSTTIFNISGSDSISITGNGPKFHGGNSTLVGAGGSSFTLAGLTFPGSTTGNPYVWLRAVASDGTIVYMPAWK